MLVDRARRDGGHREMPDSEGTPSGRAIELSARFDSAVGYARTIHAEQVRKGTSIAYLSHLLSVAALVIEDGATDENLVIGALLHDAAEDCGGRPRLEDIRAHFGDAVADVVEGCTDTFEDPKPDWRPRKEAYIGHLRDAVARGEPFVVVSLADKLHNARSILADIRELGPAMFVRFTAGSDEQLCYYRTRDRRCSRDSPSRTLESSPTEARSGEEQAHLRSRTRPAEGRDGSS